MRINNINNFINYNGNTKPVKHEEAVKSKNYDVIEITKNKTELDKNDLKLEGIKKDIVLQVNKETDSEKLIRIKESIKNKTYNTDVDEIVKRLLDK